MTGGVDRRTGAAAAPRHWSQVPPGEIARHGRATVLELSRLQQAFDREFSVPAKAAEPPAPAGGVWRRAAVRDRLVAWLSRRPFRRRSRSTVVVDLAMLARSLEDAEPRHPEDGVFNGVSATQDGATQPGPRSILLGQALRRAGDLARKQTGVLVAAIETSCALATRGLRTGAADDVGVRVLQPLRTSQAAAPELSARLERALAKEFRTGLGVLAAGTVLIGGWATLVPLASAVTVPGSLVVESNVKKVQHPTGGTVAQIDARDGMHVTEGEPVIHLDETQIKASYDVVSNQLDQVRVRLARLEAERDEKARLVFPPELVARTDDRTVVQMLASERSLFEVRATSRANQKKLLETHIVQARGEIVGLDAQTRAQQAQRDSIRTELAGIQSLRERQLVALQRVTTLQREAARLDGTVAQMTAAAAQAQTKIDEATLQIEQIDQLFRSDLLRDMRDAQDKRVELTERAAAVRDQLDHADIRAPASGVVHQLAVHTVGGVVTPAQTIMEIVPDADELEVEAKLPPNQIDHVWLGQTSLVRFSAFNQRTTPQLVGAVSYVSADLAHDPRTDAPFYTVRVALSPDQRRRLGSQQLVSGMPAEIFLQTGNRTMMSYLTKPITDQMTRTFIEP